MTSFLDRQLQSIRRDHPHSRVGIFALDATTGQTIEVASDSIFGTASLIKIPIALDLFRAAETGSVDLDRSFSLQGYQLLDQGGRDSGITKYFSPEFSVTLRFLCSLMLSISDNAATNIILSFIKRNQINSLLSDLGFVHTKITIDSIDPQTLLRDKNLLGETTPREMTMILSDLARGKILNPANTTSCLGMLSTTQTNVSILRSLPLAKNVKDKLVKIEGAISKGGLFPSELLNVQTAGLSIGNQPRIFMSIFTQGIDHKILRSPATEHPSNIIIGSLSSTIFKHLLNKT